MAIVPASLKEGPITIDVVTAVPAVLPTDDTLEGFVFTADGGNLIEIFGQVSANDGSLYLLRNLGQYGVGATTQWYPVDLDANDTKKIALDAGAPAGALAGYFSGAWLAGDARDGSGGTYVVLLVGDATFDQLYASSRRV